MTNLLVADDGVEPLLVVPVGNPGPRYAGTAGNAGVTVAEALADLMTDVARGDSPAAYVVSGWLGRKRVVMVRPRCYVTQFGTSLRQIRALYPNASLVIIHDDDTLDFGAFDLRQAGLDSTHPALASLDASIGSYVELAFGTAGAASAAQPLPEHAVAARALAEFLCD